MYAQIEKMKANKGSTVTKSVAQKKNSRKQRTGFEDNRPEVILRNKLQAFAVNTRQIANNESVVQLSRDIAQRNWRVINQYSHDQADAVVRAFLNAGYTLADANRMIVPLMDDLGHGEQVFAHGRGGSDSGTQGDTMGRIRACVQDLLAWVRDHPKRGGEKKPLGHHPHQGGDGGGKGGKKDDPSDDKDKPIGTGHLASWITGVSAWHSHRTD